MSKKSRSAGAARGPIWGDREYLCFALGILHASYLSLIEYQAAIRRSGAFALTALFAIAAYHGDRLSQSPSCVKAGIVLYAGLVVWSGVRLLWVARRKEFNVRNLWDDDIEAHAPIQVLGACMTAMVESIELREGEIEAAGRRLRLLQVVCTAGVIAVILAVILE